MTSESTPHLRKRARDYLAALPGGASPDELARDVLGLRGGPPGVAVRLVSGLLEGVTGFVREDTGRWRFDKRAITEAPSGIPRFAPHALVLGAVFERTASGGRELVELAGGAPDADDRVAILFHARAREDEAGAEDEAARGGASSARPTGGFLARVVHWLEGSLLVSYEPGEILRPLAERLRLEHGMELEAETLSLARAARRIVPGAEHRSLADLAAALGLSHYASSRASDELTLGAAVAASLLARSGAEAGAGLEALAAALESDSPDESVLEGREIRREELLALPDAPGIYRLLDREGAVIYVGKARSLRRRVAQYFHETARRDSRVERILERAHQLETEETASELVALLEEEREIRERRPAANVQREVAARGHRPARTRNLALILPAPEAERLVVLFYQPPLPLERVLLERSDPLGGPARDTLRHLAARDPRGAADPADQGARAGLEIVSSWLFLHREETSVVDLDAAAGVEDALRRIESAARTPLEGGGVEHR